MSVAEDMSSSVLSEFMSLPSRLASRSPHRSPTAYFDDVWTLTDVDSPQQSASVPSAAASLAPDDIVDVRKRPTTTYYNSWEPNRTAMGIDRVDSADLEGLGGDGDSVADLGDDDELSSSSYEHLDTRRSLAELDADRSSTDSQSLVSVTPVTDSLSATSTSDYYVSDVEEDPDSDARSSSSDDAVDADVWDGTPTRSNAAAGDNFVLRRRDDFGRGRDLTPAEVGERKLEGFDGKEVAAVRVLELELLTAELSRQMTSVRRIMRLLSCETRQLASRFDHEGHRHAAGRLAVRKEVVDQSSSIDSDECGPMAATVDDSKADVSVQRALLAEVIGELKSVSFLMSSNLQLITASSSSKDSRNSNNTSSNNNNKLLVKVLDNVCELYVADGNYQRLADLPAAVTDDKDDNDDDHGDNGDNSNVTEVSECSMSVVVIMYYTQAALR